MAPLMTELRWVDAATLLYQKLQDTFKTSFLPTRSLNSILDSQMKPESHQRYDDLLLNTDDDDVDVSS